MIGMARERRNNLLETLTFLRSVIPNANRFLVPMAINKQIQEAMAKFKADWR